MSGNGYPWELPAVAALRAGLDLDPAVTYLIGDNGSGKSTLLEAIAVACGMSAEGGSSNFALPREDPAYAFTHRGARAELARSLRLVRTGRTPRTDFYLRAESLFAAAAYLESLPQTPRTRADYGGTSLFEQSHGESFLSILIHRLGPAGLYLLDEPEAALSTQNCLTCLRRIHELVLQGSQFLISTHSPLILAYPQATIYRCTDTGVEPVAYEDAEPVVLTRRFLEARERFLAELLSEE